MNLFKAITLLAPYALLLSGCASSARFKDQPIVWQVHDSRDIPEPTEREFLPLREFADMFLLRPITRSLEIPDSEPAWNTNALDEVPNSSWFTNRIGLHPLSTETIAQGPSSVGAPVLPLTIVRGKGGGANPGFFATDARGETFLIKFDLKDNPEMQTGTSVVVNRAMWAIGYNVPNDSVFHFTRDDLHLAPDASTRDALNNKVKLTEAVVDEMLATSPREQGGVYRASASQFLPGVPKGGFSTEGVREDDPNDRIPHEHRRELRGLRVFAAWLGHTDMKEDNSLDMYVREQGRGFMRHYLVDFGEALGSHQAEKQRYEDGWEHSWDWQYQSLAFLALGMWKRPWEGQTDTPWPAVGAFGAEHFEPVLWREAYPYAPFAEADAADLYWGAKIVMRFDRPRVSAMVNAGEFSNADAANYLVDVLMARRHKIGEVWLDAVTALDQFTIKDGALCAVDLAVHYGIATTGVVEHLHPTYWPRHDDGLAEHERQVEEYPVDVDGTVCVEASKSNDYAIARLRMRRGRHFKPVLQVHYKGGAKARILGVIRVEQ